MPAQHQVTPHGARRLARRIRLARAGAELTLTGATVLATTARNGPVGLSWLARDLKERRR